MAEKTIKSFKEFYPYYLGEHRLPACRILHFMGTTAVVATLATAAVTMNPFLLIPLPILGYGPAWVSHFFIEKNRPATFTYPLWSLFGDFKMWGQMLTGKLWTGDTLTPEAAAAQ